MDGQASTRQTDALLLPLLRAAHEAESESLLAQLLSEHAEPIIKAIIRGRMHLFHVGGGGRSQDSEDVHSEVVVQLLARLHDFRVNPESNRIGNFRSYVAVITYNACHQYLRQKYPQRWRLKNRLRYLLTHHASFALWEGTDKDWLCGLAAWRDRERRHPVRAEQLQGVRDHPQSLQRAGLATGDVRHAGLADLLNAIFTSVGAPVELDALVSVVADMQEIKDQIVFDHAPEEGVAGATAEERLPDPRESVATEVERRSYLQRLWAEIMQLPLPQRSALLLNLRDAQEGVIALLPVAGIATIRQIGEAVAIPAEQFASLWNQLPLDDASIADRLGITRQQVINLRKTARTRLARRMRTFEEAG